MGKHFFQEAIKLVVSLGVCQGAGLIGVLFTNPAIPTWYAGLEKSALTPPNWVFGPVWTMLYMLMGISLYLVWRSRKVKDGACNVCEAMALFLLQLALNAVWSYVFFGLQRPFLAFLEIILLFLVLLLVIWRFWNISKPAAYLLIPYAAWVAFAAYLNFAIWQLNTY